IRSSSHRPPSIVHPLGVASSRRVTSQATRSFCSISSHPPVGDSLQHVRIRTNNGPAAEPFHPYEVRPGSLERSLRRKTPSANTNSVTRQQRECRIASPCPIHPSHSVGADRPSWGV